MTQNIHRSEDNVTYIILTRGQEAIIDTNDLECVLQLRWQAECMSDGRYYARSRSLGKSMSMQQYILRDTAPFENAVIKHINGNLLDNRRENLQWITASEKSINRKNRLGASGMQHINVINKLEGGREYKEYYVAMMRNGTRKNKAYPYTEEGLQAAKDLVAKWQEDFSYEPERTTNHQRHRRANLHTAINVGTGAHVDYKAPEKEENPSPIGDVVVISLTKGQFAIVDREDADKANAHRWHAVRNEMGGYYASRQDKTKGTVYLHRYLLDAPDDMVVDHINHNTLDNRRENLRLCTNQENCENRNGAYKNSKIGIRGVSVHKLRHGLMYIFRCHCANCKVAKYFPYTEEGLEAARVFSEAHHAAMKNIQ